MMKLKVLLTMTPTIEGGRKTPTLSWYRPTFHPQAMFPSQSDCVITFTSVNSIAPGDSELVEIMVLHPINGLKAGDDFLITEGVKETGYGKILKIKLN